LDNMHTTKQLVDHTDMDVAEHGGPGLFKAARDMKRHSYQMMEEPTGIKELLAPKDSQGINHAIDEDKVMDYVNRLDRPQHEHVMNVLRAGAHLSPEIAEQSAAAIRELQAHTVSRLHAAATDDGGKWNASGFYKSVERDAKNAASTFKDRPDIIKNLQTVNSAGNTLHMDKNYPGAAGSAVRSGALLRAATKLGGNAIASAAHEIPLAGRFIGRGIEHGVEALTGEMTSGALERKAQSKLVDRLGNQRGSISFNDINKPAPGQPAPSVRLSGSPQGVTAYSENGSTSAVRRGNDLHVKSSETKPEGRNKGEGNARLVSIADRAHAQGGVMHSG